jgi:hypothetical protein
MQDPVAAAQPRIRAAALRLDLPITGGVFGCHTSC